MTADRLIVKLHSHPFQADLRDWSTHKPLDFCDLADYAPTRTGYRSGFRGSLLLHQDSNCIPFPPRAGVADTNSRNATSRNQLRAGLRSRRRNGRRKRLASRVSTGSGHEPGQLRAPGLQSVAGAERGAQRGGVFKSTTPALARLCAWLEGKSQECRVGGDGEHTRVMDPVVRNARIARDRGAAGPAVPEHWVGWLSGTSGQSRP